MTQSSPPEATLALVDTLPRELDSRTSHGIHVRLLWHSTGDRISVAVEDTKAGHAFEILVESDQRPLDVFHHPYAYAADRLGIPCVPRSVSDATPDLRAA